MQTYKHKFKPNFIKLNYFRIEVKRGFTKIIEKGCSKANEKFFASGLTTFW